MNRRKQILPWTISLGAAALGLRLLVQAAPEVPDPSSPYQPGGMHYPYGALSPELARTVENADTGNPPSRFGRQASKQWAYGATWTRENLKPVANPHPAPEPQPRRDHPFDVAVNGDGTKCYVSLLGSGRRDRQISSPWRACGLRRGLWKDHQTDPAQTVGRIGSGRLRADAAAPASRRPAPFRREPILQFPQRHRHQAR